ncbi:MAG: hypothetical protein LBK68_06865 [Candidatus Margulisbacteria bacterium]|jgi:hypothetical protein|nr:hypothetical protein [Candidatus Margulisiibacteriota bacterium]
MFLKLESIGRQEIVTYPNPKWDEYIDGKRITHRQIGGRFWDELQIKPDGAGDYANHAIFNAYQEKTGSTEIKNTEGKDITVDKYRTPNLLAAKDAEMLSEFIDLANHFEWYQDGFRPEIILMNFYGLQKWTNAHVHLYAGARQSQFWTVLDGLIKVKDNEWFSLYYWDLPYMRLAGTRNDDKTRENVLAINITSAAQTDGVWDYAKLVKIIEDLTANFQSGLTHEQRHAPVDAGFGGYGSLVFLPDERQVTGQAYYIIEKILKP